MPKYIGSHYDITLLINSSSSFGSSNIEVDFNKVLRKYNNGYEAKIQEALLIDKLKTKLNLCANVSFFFINVF